MNKTGRRIDDHTSVNPPVTETVDAADVDSPEESLSPLDLARMQREKIEAIRRAIAAGAYDSEEMLEKALTRMLERMESDDDAS